jgi:hypothetical protein
MHQLINAWPSPIIAASMSFSAPLNTSLMNYDSDARHVPQCQRPQLNMSVSSQNKQQSTMQRMPVPALMPSHA